MEKRISNIGVNQHIDKADREGKEVPRQQGYEEQVEYEICEKPKWGEHSSVEENSTYQKVSSESSSFNLNPSNEQLRDAFIWSEILARPVSKKRRHR